MKNVKEQKIYIFDVDDTLLECQNNYWAVIVKFMAKMVEVFGRLTPIPKDIADKQQEIDKKLVETYGYQVCRFPQSFVETYKYFFREKYGNENYDENAINEMYEIGNSVFKVIPREIPYAKEILKKLKDDGHILYMLTAGDENVQAYKIANTGLSKMFEKDQIFIRIRKGVKEFGEVYEHITSKYGNIDKKDICMVGDSLRSDIQPALEFGINAIHIDVSTWSHNNVEMEGYDYTILKSLEELYGLIA